jgi:P-type E1-E2 ATPase
MIEVNIPGRGSYRLNHLVCDVNGTLAVDGVLIDGLPAVFERLRDRLELHLITADTHGRQQTIDAQLHVQAVRLQPGNEAQQKAQFVCQLGASQVVAIGQGANDARMLEEASLGICILSAEGTYPPTLMAADLVVPNIFSALELLEKPQRIVASLRQ